MSLKEAKNISLKIFISQFTNIMVVILLIGVGISILIGEKLTQ